MEFFSLFMLLLLCCSSSSDAVLLAPPPADTTAALALRVGFYAQSCPQAEAIVLAQVQKRFLIDKTITPALLRMLFHDAFVRGTDASILLDSKPGNESEKAALPNLTIRGFDLINIVKEAVEAACPGIVSCADIIVMAVRDSVALAGGPKYEVPTGRLDGKVSIKEEALTLPSPAFPVEQSQESFRQKGLDLEDMVALLGAHTVGVALCGFFNDRLFNFHGTGAADPTMNPQLVTRLSGVCPNPFFTESNADPPIDLDQSTGALFDSVYFSQIIAGNGILQIDQEITANPSTANLVQSFTSTTAFFPAFVRSIIKMGNVGVITGANPLGEVRRQCNVSNSGGVVRTPAKPAPSPGNISKPPPLTKPAPAGPVTKPPAPSEPAPSGHVTKPPPSRPAPAGHVTRPPGNAKPAPAVHAPKPPVTKPAPAGPVTKPPRTPIPKTPPVGHVSKPPTTPVTKPAPAGHVSKPPISKSPPSGHVTTPAPITEPPPSGHVKKPAPVHPVTKPPAGHVSKPAPSRPIRRKPHPITPVMKPAPPGHGSKPAPVTPIVKPGPPDQISKPPAAPASHVSSPPPHHVAKPAPRGGVSKPPVRPAHPHQDGVPQTTSADSMKKATSESEV